MAKRSPFDNTEPVPARTQESVFGVQQETSVNLNENLESIPTVRAMHNETRIQPQTRTVTIPAGSELIIFNKEFAPSLLNELSEIETAIGNIKPITSQNDVVDANAILKKGQRFAKKFEEERKAMGDVLKQHTDELLSIQKNTLADLLEAIQNKNSEIVIFQRNWQKEQDEKAAAILKAQQAETARINAENQRKQNILNLIAQFESNTLNALATATIENIDALTNQFSTFKLKEESYMEYMPQALAMQKDLTFKFMYRKEELMKLAELEKTNAAQAEQLKLQQQQKADADKQAAADRIATQEAEISEQAQSDIANSQMATELKTSVLPAAKNVMKRWVFDIENIDMAALPLEYHTFDASKIKEAIAAGCRSIPGVYIHEEISNVKR